MSGIVVVIYPFILKQGGLLTIKIQVGKRTCFNEGLDGVVISE